MKNKWKYFDGDFTADQYNDTLLKYSPWSGHRRFGYDLVAYYEPENLVELGSFYGCSTFAFMQAVKENNLNTEIFPIDLWEAEDQFTIHDYEQDVYGFFKEIYNREFLNLNVKLMKMNFDDALPNFKDGSIDVLHIDGSHAYEDVRHDFESWISKVKVDGIVLFHDISDQLLYGKTLGSCIFWKELKETYPYTAEMQHSWGLGVLFLSEKKYRDFLEKVDLSHYLNMCIYEETLAKDRIRTDYFKLLDSDKWIISLKQDKKAAGQDNDRLLSEINKIKRSYSKAEDEKNIYIEELKKTVQKYEQTVEAKDAYTEELKETIQKYEQTVAVKDTYARELNETIRKYEDTFAGKDNYIGELTETIHAYKQENQEISLAYEQTIEAKEAYINELGATIKAYEDTFTAKDRYIEELQAVIEAYKEENQQIKNAYEHTIQGKDAYIEELEAAKKTRR